MMKTPSAAQATLFRHDSTKHETGSPGIASGVPRRAGLWLLALAVLGGAIPEPSTYAALFGLAALGFAAYRRR